MRFVRTQHPISSALEAFGGMCDVATAVGFLVGERFSVRGIRHITSCVDHEFCRTRSTAGLQLMSSTGAQVTPSVGLHSSRVERRPHADRCSECECVDCCCAGVHRDVVTALGFRGAHRVEMRFVSDDAPRRSSVTPADMQLALSPRKSSAARADRKLLLSPPRTSSVTPADRKLLSPPRKSPTTRVDATLLSPGRGRATPRADMTLCSTREAEAPARRASCVTHAEMKLCSPSDETRRASSATHAEMRLFRSTTRDDARWNSVPGSNMKLFSNMEHAKLRSGSQQNGAATPVQSPRSNASLSLELIISSVWPDLDQNENEEFLATQPRRPASPHDYHLAIDYTAAKMLTAVMEQVRLLQGTSAQCRDESHELLAALVSVHEILQLIVGCPCLDRYQQVLVDILLHSTKAFAFVERLLCSKALPTSSHGVHKAALRMGDFACRFFHLTVRLCEDYETSDDDLRTCVTPREERMSFGVTSYAVPLRKVAERLQKRKRVRIAVRDGDGRSQYNVELGYARAWFHKEGAMSAKVESSDRGFSQTLQAARVKVEKGSWGWEEARDTVLITYDHLMVANVAAMSGSLLAHTKTHASSARDTATHSSPKALIAQPYRTSVQIVGSSRIDSDLQNLFIKGAKDKERVYYKCYVNSSAHQEVLGVYRFLPPQFQHTAEGTLHIVGRGNQPGLRHVLVSIFATLGFTPAA